MQVETKEKDNCRLCRGGGWKGKDRCQVSGRDETTKTYRFPCLGFRIVMGVK